MNKNIEAPDVRFVFLAMLAWLTAALVCALLAALMMRMLDVPGSAVGYISSAMSFIAAAFAGAKGMRVRKKGAVYTGLVSGVAVTTLALTLGFLVSGRSIEADGVLSVVTFTLAGALCGSVFLPGRSKNSRQRPVRKRKK